MQYVQYVSVSKRKNSLLTLIHVHVVDRRFATLTTTATPLGYARPPGSTTPLSGLFGFFSRHPYPPKTGFHFFRPSLRKRGFHFFDHLSPLARFFFRFRLDDA